MFNSPSGQAALSVGEGGGRGTDALLWWRVAAPVRSSTEETGSGQFELKRPPAECWWNRSWGAGEEAVIPRHVFSLTLRLHSSTWGWSCRSSGRVLIWWTGSWRCPLGWAAGRPRRLFAKQKAGHICSVLLWLDRLKQIIFLLTELDPCRVLQGWINRGS